MWLIKVQLTLLEASIVVVDVVVIVVVFAVVVVDKTKKALLSQTFQDEENKVPSVFSILHQGLR